jgi:hypothetical protein
MERKYASISSQNFLFSVSFHLHRLYSVDSDGAGQVQIREKCRRP